MFAIIIEFLVRMNSNWIRDEEKFAFSFLNTFSPTTRTKTISSAIARPVVSVSSYALLSVAFINRHFVLGNLYFLTGQILCSANCEIRELLILGVEAFIALNLLLVEVRGLQIRCGRNRS